MKKPGITLSEKIYDAIMTVAMFVGSFILCVELFALPSAW